VVGVVRVPAIVPEEDMVLSLLDHHGVMVHPGFFFDFPAEAFLVVSLLPAPETFGRGVEAVASTVHGLLPPLNGRAGPAPQGPAKPPNGLTG